MSRDRAGRRATGPRHRDPAAPTPGQQLHGGEVVPGLLEPVASQVGGRLPVAAGVGVKPPAARDRGAGRSRPRQKPPAARTAATRSVSPIINLRRRMASCGMASVPSPLAWRRASRPVSRGDSRAVPGLRQPATSPASRRPRPGVSSRPAGLGPGPRPCSWASTTSVKPSATASRAARKLSACLRCSAACIAMAQPLLDHRQPVMIGRGRKGSAAAPRDSPRPPRPSRRPSP